MSDVAHRASMMCAFVAVIRNCRLRSAKMTASTASALGAASAREKHAWFEINATFAPSAYAGDYSAAHLVGRTEDANGTLNCCMFP
ncbi:hypothetical protein QN219_06005 [Sinorhizobium sp. 7-81]|uniref:hypothetical protein n=1 Tax=Sinorhizobium sp. 8-89 TaxID=3049089 RepID=UPI0024C24B95|nr:hypothetical protein [Sinorhizobium sp. 8-89]MDK1489610.1 hypothetical protein [Sinorhizobium sp. 8-89]